MKKNKIIYWVSTTIIAVMMVFSAYSYFSNEEVKAGFVHLGFPDYFRIELGTAKLLGAVILLIPAITAAFKQFAYFGFGITFVSAFIAHMAAGDAASHTVMPLIFLGILAVSWFYHSKTINPAIPV